MQFHLDGFRTGDPALLDAATPSQAPGPGLPAEADVLIVGCGPAGLTLAAQLAAFPDIRTVIVEQKPGPLQLGQADGIACRTMEMFEAFGFAHQVLREAYWVNETCFWKPGDAARDGRKPIVRSARVPDVEEGLSHMPHVILNQARIHDFYLEKMQKSSTRLAPHYGRRLTGLVREADEASGYPVTATFERQGDGHQSGGGPARVETIRARYVVGCDGARSAVRQSMGLALKGDSANHAWGVMDVLVNTDFPDIRFKALIQSASEGSIVLIPREGGYMVRIYVEMDKLNEHERVAGRNITIEQLVAAAQRIFHPYTLDVKEVAWWSVYEIGQRLCDRFDDVAPGQDASHLPRIFIAGDACHTHSPKAGQGMNVSMQDAFNLGWKLAAVLHKRSPPSLLQTYSAERQAVATELIGFDREWAAMLSGGAAQDPGAVQRYFVQHGRYTAGTATRYKPALLTAESAHEVLAEGLVAGTRFHSAPVVRIGDGKNIQLGEALLADGRWRLMAFAGRADTATPDSPLGKLCAFLKDSPLSPLRRYTPAGADMDSVFDVRAVFQQSHHHLAITAMPELLFPHKGRLGLRDYEKAYCALETAGQDIYALRGINWAAGCLVVVRPDQYIAHVLPLDGTAELAAFFAAFMLEA
ncbi:MAG: 3-hydroxybenzoate 4-monooxygenase [Comamonadaceae bacterium]|nr:MAG: 3-hydroxybenzoate 4-monooxygenase [Comamonadaceae bacterium]